MRLHTVTAYNSSEAISGIRAVNCRFPSWPATQNTGLESTLVVFDCGEGFGLFAPRSRLSTPRTHKAVVWRLFHVGHLVLGVSHLVELITCNVFLALKAWLEGPLKVISVCLLDR